MVVLPAIILNGFTSTGGANPKVVEEKFVGTNVPPVENESLVIAIGPKAPFVVKLFAMVTRAVLPAEVMAFPERSFATLSPAVSIEK